MLLRLFARSGAVFEKRGVQRRGGCVAQILALLVGMIQVRQAGGHSRCWARGWRKEDRTGKKRSEYTKLTRAQRRRTHGRAGGRDKCLGMGGEATRLHACEARTHLGRVAQGSRSRQRGRDAEGATKHRGGRGQGRSRPGSGIQGQGRSYFRPRVLPCLSSLPRWVPTSSFYRPAGASQMKNMGKAQGGRRAVGEAAKMESGQAGAQPRATSGTHLPPGQALNSTFGVSRCVCCIKMDDVRRLVLA